MAYLAQLCTVIMRHNFLIELSYAFINMIMLSLWLCMHLCYGHSWKDWNTISKIILILHLIDNSGFIKSNYCLQRNALLLPPVVIKMPPRLCWPISLISGFFINDPCPWVAVKWKRCELNPYTEILIKRQFLHIF